MKIGIIFASNAGSNFVVGEVIKEVLESKGNEVFLKKAKEASHEDFESCELVILGSPSWYVNETEGMPHEYMLEFMSKIESANEKKMAFYGCGDKSYLQFCGAVDIMEKTMLEKGAKKYCDSLKLNHFFFHIEENIAIAKKWAESI